MRASESEGLNLKFKLKMNLNLNMNLNLSTVGFERKGVDSFQSLAVEPKTVVMIVNLIF